MTAYTATFADGRSISLKNSRREYAAAWRYQIRRPDGTIHGNSGFAADAEKAGRAVKSEVNYALKHYRGKATLIGTEIVEVARS